VEECEDGKTLIVKPRSVRAVRSAMVIALGSVSTIAILINFHDKNEVPQTSPIRQEIAAYPTGPSPAEGSKVIHDAALSGAGAMPLQKGNGAFLTELAEIQTAHGQRLLALYKAGIAHGATPERKYIAMQITLACSGYVNPPTLARRIADAMSQLPAGSPQREIMEDRLDVLATRCAPLDSVGKDTWHAELRRLSSDLAAAESPFTPIPLVNQDGTPASDEQLSRARQQVREALDAYGPLALNWFGGNLVRVANSAKVQPGQIDFGGADAPSPAVGVALAIAPCLAGQPCDSNSLFAMGMCVGSGGVDCGESLEASLLSHLPDDAARARANLLASQIVAAIAARDWTRLGL